MYFSCTFLGTITIVLVAATMASTVPHHGQIQQLHQLCSADPSTFKPQMAKICTAFKVAFEAALAKLPDETSDDGYSPMRILLYTGQDSGSAADADLKREDDRQKHIFFRFGRRR